MQERVMLKPTHVLIITRDETMRNLLEQVFMIRDVQVVIAVTVQGAEASIDLWDVGTFGLVIIDTAALGECESDQKHVACHILENWTATHPTLPFLFLGTILQKHAIHMIRADIVRILVKPFRLDELVDAIDELYLGKSYITTSLPPHW
jgi:DNA-binding NtrC family response regulator